MRTARLLTMVCLVTIIAYGNAFAEEITWHAEGKGGAIAGGGKEAVAAGLSILRQGGNAADAASATLLALSVTDYGYLVIGAEVPLIIYDAKKDEVKVLSGLGGAPLDPKAMEWYYKNGIPGDGGMKSAPVPAVLSLCVEVVKLYGTMSFEQVVAPSLALLDKAEREWHPNLAATLRKLIDTERIIEGGISRMQPIFLTSLTTIAGVFPLVFADEIWRGLSLAIIFGLIFSTVLTLVMVPITYAGLCRKEKNK